ncbi:MAG: hypothetical protein LBN97_03255 [Oscillospiraceae bacterium]|jgi:hypothetical protein|nr:hypothetical protein [Oscillospiraceae bacterium]
MKIDMHAHTHNGASVVSTDFSAAKVRGFAESIAALAREVEDYGALIGHIKGYVEPSGAATFSVTDASTGVSVIYNTDVKLGLTAICYNITPEKLADYVLTALREATDNYALEAELCSEEHTETI